MNKQFLLIWSAILFCAAQAFAGTEEVSLYSMSTWSSTYEESIGWNASYDNSTHTITYSSAWGRIGWNFLWKWINTETTAFTIEFASATTTNGEVTVRYKDNNTNISKNFGFEAGVTSVTCDLHTDFEDGDSNGGYSLMYINIAYASATSLQLNRVYFTTTADNDLYQAENADFAGYTENFTEADNTIIKVENSTDDDHVTFTIDVPYTAVYRLNIGYNNGTSNNDRACNLKINDGSDIGITLPQTGSEGNKTVGEVAYSAILNSGTNTIKIYGNWKWYNIDYLRVYMPDLYLLGNQVGTYYEWKCSMSQGKMTFDAEREEFSITTRIGMNTNGVEAGTFAFVTTVADNEDSGGWSYVNGHRWGPSTDELAVTSNGTTAITNIEKRGNYSYKVPMAGTYTITVKADLSSFTIEGPEVYMFGLFEGSGYNWATNAYAVMDFDATDNVYRLRTRIADAAATDGDGEVAFATGYSDDNNWTYLNANRYGPSSNTAPALDNSANTIGRNGETKFTGISAHKYDVAVDMFSATKTARFNPVYTFGYEVVGTPAHGSIACSTDDSEIPNGSSVTVTATPDAGYRFVKWTDGSDTQLSTSASYSPTITADTWLKAWFEPDPSCLLTIAATDFAFARHNDDIYPVVENSFIHQDNNQVYFDYSSNADGAEFYYPVHLDAGTYYFYGTLSGDGANPKLRLYAQDVDGTLLYSGKKWTMSDDHSFTTNGTAIETKGFTVTAGDYLIALYAERNTRFSQIDVVGVCNGATTNTYALTLSAGSNGAVASDQISNGHIINGTEVLLVAVPNSSYRFCQWSDGNTDNPRTVTMTSDLSLTASFNRTNGCLNTITRECESASVTPATAPVAVPTTTSTGGDIITIQEGGKMLYYAFELTEPVTCSLTLFTPRSDKRQALYLYSAQLTSGTSLVYDGTTYYQSDAPTAANSSNSGTNHIYPVCSHTVALAAGKYVVGVYSEYSWSQYDKLVISAGANDIDCSLADITIAAGDEVDLPYVVNNLTVHQGGVATNTHDVEIRNSITYIRPACGGANSNQMNHWYPFCLPFTPNACKVYDVADAQDYSIGAIYLQGGDEADSPSGTGYFYLEYLKEENLSAVGNEFRTRWAYIEQALPEAYVPYIIMFVNHWEDTNTDDDYFENNPTIKFIGGAQTIDGMAKIDRITDDGTEKYYYYGNNTLAPITLSSAYVFIENANIFDYREDVTVAPFECYIQATESFKARHKTIAVGRVRNEDNTATGVESLASADETTVVYDLAGRSYTFSDIANLPKGVWIVKQGARTYKLLK